MWGGGDNRAEENGVGAKQTCGEEGNGHVGEQTCEEET